MGKSKMDDAAAERIRRARGDKDGFTKRAADAARRNDQCQEGGQGSPSSKVNSSGQGGSSSGQNKK